MGCGGGAGDGGGSNSTSGDDTNQIDQTSPQATTQDDANPTEVGDNNDSPTVPAEDVTWVNFEDAPIAPVAEGVHELFGAPLGGYVRTSRIGVFNPDPTGQSVLTDKDGDGIPDTDELTTDAYIADYPHIVTRIALPVTMELRLDETDVSKNHSETISEDDVDQTIDRNMETRQYAQLNLKTTPYVVKEASSEFSSSFSDTSSTSSKSGSTSFNAKASGNYKLIGASASNKSKKTRSTSSTQNNVHSDTYSRSSYSERTVFEDVSYVDNLDHKGMSLKDRTVSRISKNYRNSDLFSTESVVGPNAGLVRAGLYLKNPTVNIPVKVSNILATLSFKTPQGAILPIKTFTLTVDDNPLEQAIMGGDEVGPFTVEVANLNTAEVKNALLHGYIPQISIVSYDLTHVNGTNYTVDVENLKMVEETAKGRTALIKISAPGVREDFRVVAFEEFTDPQTSETYYSPGLSLKKALFRIYQNKLRGDEWDEGSLTVADHQVWWRNGNGSNTFQDGVNGNDWDRLETMVKSYIDDNNQTQKLEVIKRIGQHQIYNPFDVQQNPAYNPNVPLPEETIRQMQYWVVLHNGEYFEGDINDPIWVGDRYEIILFNVGDFHDHFQSINFSPLQSNEPFYLATRWNRLTESDELSRSVKLGTILKGEVIQLKVKLDENYTLFDQADPQATFGIPSRYSYEKGTAWRYFNYSFDQQDTAVNGIPSQFMHAVQAGHNGMEVFITESTNAATYEISICSDALANCGSPVVVEVTSEQLAVENGLVLIHRKTPTKSGGVVGALSANDYKVDVSAIGQLNSVPVSTHSDNNGNTLVSVTDSADQPGAFTYSMVSYLNQIEVRVEPSNKAEYYLIKVLGPFNYGFVEGVDTPLEIIGHAGSNLITVDTPDQETLEENGVYQVQVYAINANTLDGSGNELLDVAGVTSTEFVEVEYDVFHSARGYSAMLNSALANAGDIDLELNFNDGSGWHRVALSPEDALKQDQVLDVQNQFYIKQNERLFTLFVDVPDTVFTGGREETEVYIRTPAENEYRDSFWLKPPANFADATKGLYLQKELDDLVGKNPVKHWVEMAETDASLMENSIDCFSVANTNADYEGNLWFEPDYCNQQAMAFIFDGDVDMNQFFFSPQTERLYEVSVDLQAALPEFSSSAVPEVPRFTVRNIDKQRVVVGDFQSARAETYKVYFREGRAVNVLANEVLEAGEWLYSPGLDATVLNQNYTIGGLMENYSNLKLHQYYSFVVTASNLNGTQRSQAVEVYTGDVAAENVLPVELQLLLVL